MISEEIESLDETEPQQTAVPTSADPATTAANNSN